jgi:uncharacterized protein
VTTATIIAGAVVVYAGILFSLWRFQERIVFQPPIDRERGLKATRQLEYRSRDGVDLVAHVVEPDGTGQGFVVAFHGNAVIARWLIPWARELARQAEVVVVLPEYRGYDGRPGQPTYEGSANDASAALEAVVREFGADPAAMTFYGHSLGSAVATELAAVARPAALVLESPFTSVREMANRWYFFGVGMFWKPISRVHYDTRGHVSVLDVPVHVAHGKRDVVVPVRMGRAVHGAARRPGQLLLVDRAGHNDLSVVGGQAYWSWIRNAVRGQ